MEVENEIENEFRSQRGVLLYVCDRQFSGWSIFFDMKILRMIPFLYEKSLSCFISGRVSVDISDDIFLDTLIYIQKYITFTCEEDKLEVRVSWLRTLFALRGCKEDDESVKKMFNIYEYFCLWGCFDAANDMETAFENFKDSLSLIRSNVTLSTKRNRGESEEEEHHKNSRRE